MSATLDGAKQYGRVLEAEDIGVYLVRAFAEVRCISKSNDTQ